VRQERLQKWVNISAMRRFAAVLHSLSLHSLSICAFSGCLLLALVLLRTPVVMGANKSDLPPLPYSVSGNAVAAVKNGFELFSIMGVGPKKTWDDVTNKVYILTLSHPKWRQGPPIPGVAGRLGAAAAGAKGQVVLMGGYVLDPQGAEITVPDVNINIAEHKWYRAKDIPVPVDRGVAGTNHDRFVYLIGGRSSRGPVNNVQVYDVEKDAWTQATPFPGTPVFGQAGGLADDSIVIVDGAKAGPAGGPGYVASNECWLGKIDRKDPNKIEWSKLPPHPGSARFGIASGGSNREHRVFFSGGTPTPHDYKGVAYDGQPSEASTITFDYDLHAHHWETVTETTTDVRIDGGGIVDTLVGPIMVGGMDQDLAPTTKMILLPKK
jgi:N-acetylneuraminic acid mutarotase